MTKHFFSFGTNETKRKRERKESYINPSKMSATSNITVYAYQINYSFEDYS